MEEHSGTLIKVCGITREEDARQALSCGVDALGLVFYDDSPRYVAIGQAAAIAAVAAGRALKVGLFVDADAEAVRETLARVPLDILQFHGNETAQYCRQFGLPYWKALRVREAVDLPAALALYPDASGILLDAWHPALPGGTGRTFDWSLLETLPDRRRLILAGGLTPDNVAEAVKTVRPRGVDVSSGVEEAPGIKSGALMKKFVDEVRRV